MKAEFTNRLGMFNTALTTLSLGKYKSVWFNQPPAVFTVKVAAATDAVAALTTFCQQQETIITGSAEEKAREAAEAEDAVHPIARAMVQWFRDHNDETNAGKVDLQLSDWRRLRDQELLGQLRVASGLAQGIINGPQAAAAADYDLTPAKVTALGKEIEDYAKVINAPQTNIADRKSLTTAMRNQFNAVEARFVALDDMILSFNTSAEGRALVAAYQAARVVRDLGVGPTPTPPTPPSPTPPQ